ncbi:FAD-binding oxidoreductase [Shimia ponticola]|uniref:FAD-binding oxidoreductase n=1 Tax=Shimia ponticola TaxID=2582893 RepID=UPI0011BF7C4D|nr:FAD-binding oxidoreductase [Shimia ponticola]
MTWRSGSYTGWGRALVADGPMARPERLSALHKVAGQAPAIGNRRSYADACLNDDGSVIDMTRLDRIIDFDPNAGTVTVEAGVTLGDLTTLLAPRGWMPAVLPGTGHATVGGAIAMDVHGKNHVSVGSFGQQVRSLTVLRNGQSEVETAGSDEFRASVGGLGQTGIITQATLSLAPCPGTGVRVRERRMDSFDEHIAQLEASTSPFVVGWIDATATGDATGRGIMEEAELVDRTPPPDKKAKSVPFDAPHAALSGPVVRAFNAAYLRRVPAMGRTRIRSIDDFFFPLDRIANWNRLYGKRGFHQFQCVVPTAEADALKDMLEFIGTSGLASPLVVLKKLGEGRGGMMSFPMEGYTLAVDFPARAKAADVIKRLNQMTADVGGRVYLAKDAFLEPDQVASMYPDHAAWAKIAAKSDPEGALMTALVRRLKLREVA